MEHKSTDEISIYHLSILTKQLRCDGYLRIRHTLGTGKMRISDWFNDTRGYAKRFLPLVDVRVTLLSEQIREHYNKDGSNNNDPNITDRPTNSDPIELPWLLVGMHTIEAVWESKRDQETTSIAQEDILADDRMSRFTPTQDAP